MVIGQSEKKDPAEDTIATRLVVTLRLFHDEL